MSQREEARRSKHDRRPNEVPHHPKLLTIAWILAAAAFAIMGLWFWAILTGQGIVVTAEQNTAAANAELAAEAEAQAEAQEQRDQAEEEPTPDPVVVEPESIEIEPPAETAPAEAEEADDPADDIVPTESDTVTDQWDLGAWSVLSYDGKLVVSGNLNNISGEDQTGEVRVKVYSGKSLVATTRLNVVDFPADTSERVQIESDEAWSPGSKTLVLDYSPE